MSGMAVLLFCAVSVDPNGWQAGQPPATNLPTGLPGSGPVTADPMAASPPVSMAQNPLTGLPNAPAAAPTGTADWSDIERALLNPPGQPSRSHAGFPTLRGADGAAVPPQPPADLGRVPTTVQQQRPVAQTQPPTGQQGLIQGLGEPPTLIPRGSTTPDARMPVTADAPVSGPPRQPAREVVLEEDLTRGSFSNRQYITPPPRDTGAVVPLRNRNPQVPSDAAAQSLPNTQTSPQDKNPAIDSKTAGEERPAEKKWWPLLLTMLGLFASLGFNVYLGWIAFDIHGRYHDIADEIQDLEQKLEGGGGRNERVERRRESRRHLAG